MSCPDCAPLAEEVARLNRRVLELDGHVKRHMDRERELSMALAQAPKIGDRYRDTQRYATWYLSTRWKALHDTDTPSRRLTEPPSYAATMLPRKHGRRRD